MGLKLEDLSPKQRDELSKATRGFWTRTALTMVASLAILFLANLSIVVLSALYLDGNPDFVFFMSLVTGALYAIGIVSVLMEHQEKLAREIKSITDKDRT